uniref:RRM domain-containing protein n=1 Tax=Globisporangium ultimum (strain ATCC 200006 / CBS 805.95 / DAOM BR144) TaxID=431595 RepID=K3WPJ1_GLOUD
MDPADAAKMDVDASHADAAVAVASEAAVPVGTPASTGSDEDLKAVILNYGKWRDAKSMEAFLKEHNVDFHKVQKSRQLTFGFIHFKSREERDAALPVLQSLTWNGEPMEAKDALAKKSMQNSHGGKHDASNARGKKRKNEERDADKDEGAKDKPEAATDASDVVTPWANIPYEEQLERKEAEMKKVLVKIVRNTRKEYGKKEKRIATDQRNVARKKKKENNGEATADVAPAAAAPASASIPRWLNSHGSMYVVADGELYSRVHEADVSSTWTREVSAHDVVAIVSFGSELVAAKADNTICTLTQRGKERQWVEICKGPENAGIKSLASLRGTLLCCTVDGRVLKQEGAGRFASGSWKQIGAVNGANFIGIYNGHVYAFCPSGNAEGQWWRARLTSDALESLVFEAWSTEVTDVLGMTSHNAQLILLTRERLSYVMDDGKVVDTAPVVLERDAGKTDTMAPKFTAFASHKGLCCPTDSIHPSPVTEGYRNKCEFTIGFDVDNKPCVGFRMGLFRDGLITTSKPDQCINVSQVMKDVCATVQSLVETSSFPVYDVKEQTGVWRQLTVRESERTKDLMVMIMVKPVEGKMEELKQQILAKLTDASLPFKVTSVFMQEYDGVSAPSEDAPVTNIYGQMTIEEHLLGMRFSVSPGAFFQVNTRGAETLYSLVKDHADADENTLLYDVCCGTGTIGICASKGVGKVVGIEICKAATDDAAVNAKLNGVENVSFVNSKAEDVMKDLLRAKRADGEENIKRVVAIVDPPRAGLHHQVLRALRGCPPVERIVYVSCNPTGSLIQDAMMLCGPKTKTLVGEPFEPVHAAPVDMFPHTPHCEMIIVFERVKSKNLLAAAPTKASTAVSSE